MPDEVSRFREENRRLREALVRHGIELPSVPMSGQEAQPPTAALANDQKVTLFRALFRGREDVCAVRWERPNGRSGYTPKSERDWNAYYAAKPEDRKRVDRKPGNTFR